MRVHFQARPWDLLLAEGYVAAMAILILATGQGVLTSILLVLLIPGYLLVAALFPGNEGIGWIERIALSLGLSIVVVPLLGLALNFTPLGISLVPLVLIILAFCGSVGFAAYIRRMKLPVRERLAANLELGRPAWKEYSGMEKAITLGLVLALLLSVSILAYVATNPRPGEGFTEFYLLDSQGNVENYPTDLNLSEEGTVIVGIANHEFERVDYNVRVDLVEVEVVMNESGDPAGTTDGNLTTMTWLNLSLDHQDTWTREYSFEIDTPGSWEVRFSLYRDGDLAAAYLNLHLGVVVRSP